MFDLSPEERKLYDGVSAFVHNVVSESEPEEYSRWHFLLLVWLVLFGLMLST